MVEKRTCLQLKTISNVERGRGISGATLFAFLVALPLDLELTNREDQKPDYF